MRYSRPVLMMPFLARFMQPGRPIQETPLLPTNVLVSIRRLCPATSIRRRALRGGFSCFISVLLNGWIIAPRYRRGVRKCYLMSLSPNLESFRTSFRAATKKNAFNSLSNDKLTNVHLFDDHQRSSLR